MSNIDYSFKEQTNRAGIKETVVMGRKPRDTEDERVEELLGKKPIPSPYSPTDDERATIALVRRHFVESDVVMRKPRREFNDMSVLSRLMVDQMSFNAYQSNNGDPAPGDYIKGWQSNAMRPVVRNKCISIAAHVTAKVIYPKVFAWNKNSENQENAAIVMKDLLEYVGDCINYPYFSLQLNLTALWSPASIGELSYAEIEQHVRIPDGKGGYTEEEREDEVLSGFQGRMVPVDELYIADFYEHDIQKQPYLIRRRVKFYDVIKEEYGENPNFEYVKPGVQVLWNDANQLFYEVYDSVMRQNMVEEITYYHRTKDLKLVLLNGVLMTDAFNPNPRLDKLYPFFKFGFELMDEGSCFYYKSLAFKIQQDAVIVNTLYPMIIDGTYLSIMPPLLNTTGEIIPSNVVIPGAVTTLSQPNAGQITPLEVSKNINVGFQALQQLEQSLQESSPSMVFPNRRSSAYEQAIREREATILLGLFTAMSASCVKQMGKLMIGDIIQYMTIGEVSEIEDDAKLVYKAFLVPNKNKESKAKHKRIKFDSELPNESITDEEELNLSRQTLEDQGGLDSDTELIRVNPQLFRDLKYSVVVSPDVMSPLSEETERAFKLEIFDRAIQLQNVDQDAITKDFLFAAFPGSNHDPEKYIKKPDQTQMQNSLQQIQQPIQNQQQMNNQASPLNAIRQMQGSSQAISVPNR